MSFRPWLSPVTKPFLKSILSYCELDHIDTPWRIKSMTTWLFVQQMAQDNNIKNSKLHIRSLWVDWPHRGSVIHKTFPCHDFSSRNQFSIVVMGPLRPWHDGCTVGSLGMDKEHHLSLYWACDYLSILGLKLNHVSKMGPWSDWKQTIIWTNVDPVLWRMHVSRRVKEKNKSIHIVSTKCPSDVSISPLLPRLGWLGNW